MTCAVVDCSRPKHCRGWCKVHYERWRREGDVQQDIPIRGNILGPRSRLLPFWERVDVVRDLTSCWLWKAGSQRNQRARMKWNGSYQYVYRISWQLTYGPIPDGMHVCHRCDVPLCVRPDHLFLGSHRDNMLDGLKKGIITLPTNAPRGASHHSATATDVQVTQARELYASGRYSQRALAAQFGVSQTTIGGWVRGTSRSATT